LVGFGDGLQRTFADPVDDEWDGKEDG